VNITELEKLAKDAIPSTKRIGRASPFRNAANPQTILAMIELLREMGEALKCVYAQGDDWFNRAVGALEDYKEFDE